MEDARILIAQLTYQLDHKLLRGAFARIDAGDDWLTCSLLTMWRYSQEDLTAKAKAFLEETGPRQAAEFSPHHSHSPFAKQRT